MNEMENNKKKCSLKDHENSDAILFCPECKMYMCTKCEQLHSGLFKTHHQYNYLKNNVNEIFTGFCPENNHSLKLEFFCKDHNQLCCPACLSKMKKIGYGQHANCNVCNIEEVKDEKKNKFAQNIKYLEELSKTFQDSMNELKIMIENIEKNKEDLKVNIQKTFTKIRNALNDREDKLLLDVDDQFDNLFSYQELKKQSEKLPNKIEKSLEKSKTIENEWNNNYKLNYIINDCIKIENNIQKIKLVENQLKIFNSNNYKIEFNSSEEEINQFFKAIKKFGKINTCSQEEIFENDEKECYCKMINKILINEPELNDKLPINPKTNKIYEDIKDCSILAKLINISYPETIDERVIIKGKEMTLEDKKQYYNLIINSAKSIGCLIEITPDDIVKGHKVKILTLLQEILKLIVLKKISLKEYPQLLRLKEPKEENEELLLLGPEDFLKRWFNFHLTKAKHQNKLTNFNNDLKDSEKYIILLNQLSPNKCDLSPLNIINLKERAGKVLNFAKNIGTEIYIKEEDIQNGNEYLNLFFTAEIFLSNHGMGEPTEAEKATSARLLEDDDQGMREERIFRTWINNLKLEGEKKVYNLYEHSRNAIVLLRIIDKIKPGTVQWKKVEIKTKNPFKISVNCQEVIDASKRSGYRIISIGNKDIQEGKKKHILAVVWQLMKAHTLSWIGEKSDEQLIAWANTKVSEERKIKSLKEKKLNDGLFWIELLSAIESRCIRWNYVIKDNIDDKGREKNAKYFLSVARSLGPCNYATWKDITEVKSKILLVLLASLYYINQNHQKNN